MKNSKIMVVIILAFCIFNTGCTSSKSSQDLKIGKYVEKNDGVSWVLLKDDNQFVFSRNIATSYDPSGTYLIKDGELILTANKDTGEIYKFKVDGNSIILETDMKPLLDKGTVYIYTNEE